MTIAIIVFPGSNCDQDLATAFEKASGRAPRMVWHKETELPAGVELVALPGGFSYGDYLRPGAIAAHSPIMAAVRAHERRGGLLLGVCNGFQILTETGVLPGALIRNAGQTFVCKDVRLRAESRLGPFMAAYRAGDLARFAVAHADGNYRIDAEALTRLEGEGRIAFRYVDQSGATTPEANPNGAVGNIAGVLSETGRALGLMPHPERLNDPRLGGDDGARFFSGVIDALATA